MARRAATVLGLAGLAGRLMAADFSGGPTDDAAVPSMGVVKVIVAPAFQAVMAGYPGFFAPNRLYSPVLYDANTVIGRSAPHVHGIPGSTPVGNLGTPTAYADFANVPTDFQNPLAPTREVFTEIRRMTLVTMGGGVSCSNRVDDPRIPAVPPGIPIIMAGPDGGAAAPALPRSLGQVQSKTPGANPANDFPARSFFDVFVEVNIPAFGSFPGAVLRNTQPMVVTNQVLTEFPPSVIYIHGATTASPIVFKTSGVLTDITGANPTPYSAGQVFGWLVLAGHGTQIDCSSPAAVQNFINTVLGPPGNERADLPLPAGNILWVSDASPGSANNSVFSPAGSNYTDSAFVSLLQNAGYNVMRMNTPDNGSTNLTAAELAAMNTNDLIIVGRAAGSAAWQNQQATNWNRDVTKPVMIMSPYLIRTDGNRVGWFGGGNGVLPDSTPAPLTPGLSGHPAIDYVFQDVSASGTNTSDLFEEPMDRNTSQIANPPVAGAVVIATHTFAREDNLAIITNANAIVGFPAGTLVRGGADILPAYRMYFGGGTRESATAPNAIPLYTGRESLSPMGEKVFLRAVQLAMNNGVAPTTNEGPAGFLVQPVNATAPQGGAVDFSVAATGAAPRLVYWLRSDGGGGFTNIPNTEGVLAKSTLKLAALGLSDSGAQFAAVVSNAFNVVTSDVVNLVVDVDLLAPVALSAASMDGNSITVLFDEALGAGVTTDPGNYQVDGGAITVISAAIRPDGKSVDLVLNTPLTAPAATVDVFGSIDIFGNFGVDVVSVTATNYRLTGVDVGAVNPPGTNVVFSASSFQVTGGGLDATSTADIMRLVHRTVTGDFDARVRVLSLVGTNDHFETTAKAFLVARESTANNAAGVRMAVTPPAPGDGDLHSTYRATTGGATNYLALPVPSGMPGNAWMRIRRVGGTISAFRSVNGTDWIPMGNTATALPATLTVGVGVVSHRNGKVVTGTFSEFRIAPIPLAVVLTNSSPAPGVFSASFQSQGGFNYSVEYKDALPGASWLPLTNILGDGTLQGFTDPGPVSPTGNRFYRIGAQ